MSLALRASFGLRPSLMVTGAARVIRPSAVINWSLVVIGAARVIKKKAAFSDSLFNLIYFSLFLISIDC